MRSPTSAGTIGSLASESAFTRNVKRIRLKAASLGLYSSRQRMVLASLLVTSDDVTEARLPPVVLVDCTKRDCRKSGSGYFLLRLEVFLQPRKFSENG
jgi:hypothetical protein